MAERGTAVTKPQLVTMYTIGLVWSSYGLVEGSLIHTIAGAVLVVMAIHFGVSDDCG